MKGNFKEIEHHLYEYKNIDSFVKLIDIKIKKLTNDIDLPIGDVFAEKSSKTNKFSSVVESEVIRRDEVVQKEINKLKQLKVYKIIQKKIIDTSLELLEEEERNLVELRYFSKPTKTWTSIASELNQSVDNCIKVRKKVINKLSNYIIL